MDCDPVVRLLKEKPGLSDREIADLLLGPGTAQQPINGIRLRLAKKNLIVRRPRQDGILGNYLGNAEMVAAPSQISEPAHQPSLRQIEDHIKQSLARYLASQGWTVLRVAWGKTRGVDMEAKLRGQHWLIELKGIGSRPQMRANYFLGVPEELLLRMNDAASK